MQLPRSVKNILFVCYGNLCRSVLAEAVMKRLLSQSDLGRISVASAGIAALPNSPAPGQIVELAEEHGLDVTQHRTKSLDRSCVDWADLVLVVESYLGEEISSAWPEADTQKIYLLGDFAQGEAAVGEIRDPYGGSGEALQRCYGQIEVSVRGLVEILVSRNAVPRRR